MKSFNLFYRIVLISLLIGIFSGCEEDSVPVGTDPTDPPQIISLTADRTIIPAGDVNPVIITCEATGGGLNFLWEVDLGDLFPANDDFSSVSFTGALCCTGWQSIKCTVSNTHGTVSDTIQILIEEPFMSH